MKMESVLIVILCSLCGILIYNLLKKLRYVLPWRVNCWFCNSNTWVKLDEANSWTCPQCDQYNGFTKDGDYNKPLFTKEQVLRTPKISRSPPKNGLCQMCNINQQLKVTQLANFVPMHEKNYDEEIDVYRCRLEKAYKLCSPCKKVVQFKLHKEKEHLLGSKLLNSRTPERKNGKQEIQRNMFTKTLNMTSFIILGILTLLLSIECFDNLTSNKQFLNAVMSLKDSLYNTIEKFYSITNVSFLESNYQILNNIMLVKDGSLKKLMKYTNVKSFDEFSRLSQEVLSGVACFIQILGHVFNVNKLKYALSTDLLLTLFVMACIIQPYMAVKSVAVSFVKISLTSVILLILRKSTKKEQVTPKVKSPNNKRIKNLANQMHASKIDDHDTSASSLESDDDVSLNRFGLNNLDSSNENTTTNSRVFSHDVTDGVWMQPKLNSTFCANSTVTKPARSISEATFVKPSFSMYHNIGKDDSDSDLDKSIYSLSISSPKKHNQKTNSMFNLRKFNATPRFVAPTIEPMLVDRPLISPSKLGHSTSWVAGGYWGSEGERQFNVEDSRSSSQSSGFESQASSATQRNLFSQPPSREESIFGDVDKHASFDRLSVNSHISSLSCQTPHAFARIGSPVYPQMQYNGYVHIPQPRQATPAHNPFAPQYVQSSTFKTPSGSRLIKLPQMNTFSSR